ncbi:MAG TPA: NAD(P)H-hydrate dehydratase [Pirellulales bacterium]|jgi:NAD(P)H-hydrate epimerase|nr:NAD(P)H-hydrate dehydratase [Pirellulales bacterium]
MNPPDERFPPLPRLAPRNADSHKGDFGRALVIGGSRGMAGAVALAGMAALRSGAGLVKLATSADCQSTVAAFEPSVMTIGLAADAEGRIAASARATIAELAVEATAVACGPGLGRSQGLVELVGWLYKELKQPLILDADGLNALAQQPDLLSKAGGPRILTPHPGEFARLVGLERIGTSERESLARQLAGRTGAIVVLKGHRTVITDGKQLSLNPTGNPGMATGGTGDVLTGVITALICQQLSPYDAARLGVYVHGLAGDLAAADLGQISLMASDLIAYLPTAWRQVQQ